MFDLQALKIIAMKMLLSWLFYCLQFVCPLLVFSMGMLLCNCISDVSGQLTAVGVQWGVVAVVVWAVGRDLS